jgi:hypothetical protein
MTISRMQIGLRRSGHLARRVLAELRCGSVPAGAFGEQQMLSSKRMSLLCVGETDETKTQTSMVSPHSSAAVDGNRQLLQLTFIVS